MYVTQRRKSRSLWFADLFSNLQSEFMVSLLRYHINYERVYKKKYLDICEYKKKDIMRLAYRNKKNTIFCHIHIYKKYLDELFGDQYGLPKFIYVDKIQKINLSRHDLYYFFIPDSQVIYDTKKATIIKNDTDNKKITIVYDEKDVSVDYSAVKSKWYNVMNVSESTLSKYRVTDMRQILK